MDQNTMLEALQNASAEEKREAANAILPFAAEVAVQEKLLAKSGNARAGRIDSAWEEEQIARHPNVVVVENAEGVLSQADSTSYFLLKETLTPQQVQVLLEALGEKDTESWVYVKL